LILKISTTTAFGLLVGLAIGVIGMDGISLPSNSWFMEIIHNHAWWIVILSMLVPLADYLSGSRTTLGGIITGHSFRHLAGSSPASL
jgi:hypothetical protein